MMLINLDDKAMRNVARVMDMKILGAAEIANVRSKEAIAKAAFTILASRFVQDTAVVAKTSPHKYHHIYEWKKVGVTKHKLFQLHRAGIRGGNLIITSRFINSVTKVPIDSRSRIKYNSENFHIFKKKAEFMESGSPTQKFGAKNAKALVFMYKKKLFIIKRPNGVSIKNPGGVYVAGSYTKHFNKWFGTKSKLDTAIKASGLYENIETAVTKALRKPDGGPVQARQAIYTVTEKYSKGLTII